MDARELLTSKAKSILKMLPEDDADIVYAYLSQEYRNGYRSAEIKGNVWSVLGGITVVSLLVGGSIFLGIGMFTTNQEQTRYDALKEACIERVLCTCKDLPVEAP
jgi:hypothetical protein